MVSTLQIILVNVQFFSVEIYARLTRFSIPVFLYSWIILIASVAAGVIIWQVTN